MARTAILLYYGVCSSHSLAMRSIKRFRSFEEMKSFESSSEGQHVIRKRHLVFEKFMGLIRSYVVRKNAAAKS